MAPPGTASQTRRSHCYLVTIRWNPNSFKTASALMIKYRDVVLKTHKYAVEWSDNIGFELTKHNVLHLHTYMTSMYAPWYKSSDGWIVNFTMFPLSDVDRVIKYINKEGSHPCAIQQREYESYYYLLPVSGITNE